VTINGFLGEHRSQARGRTGVDLMDPIYLSRAGIGMKNLAGSSAIGWYSGFEDSPLHSCGTAPDFYRTSPFKRALTATHQQRGTI
jgi:hypothetical protein